MRAPLPPSDGSSPPSRHKSGRIPDNVLLLLAGITAILLTALDIATPLGYGEWVLYLLPALLLTGLGRERQVFWGAGIISGLMLIGLIFSPRDIPFSVAIANRVVAYALLWIVALMILTRNRALVRERNALAERDRLASENNRQAEFFGLILDTTPIGIAAVRGPEYRYEYCNHSYARIPGRSRDEILGRTIPEIFPDYVAQGGLAVVDDVMRTGEQVSVSELETYVGSGTERRNAFFNVAFVPLAATPNQQPGVLIVAGEVTDIVLTRRHIEQTAARDEAILSSINDGLVIMSPNGTIEYINRVGLSIDGYSSRNEMRKAPPNSAGTWRICNEDGTELPVERWPLSRVLRERFRNHVYHVRRTDIGLDKYCSYSGGPIYDSDGNLTGAVATFRDVTDLHDKQQALRQSENRLSILNENLESLVIERTEQVRTLSKALTLAEQRERKRFSYVLHENLQQLLLSARILMSEHIREHKAAPPTTAARAETYEDIMKGLSILDRALQTTSSLSVELNPPVLRTQGLDAALEWLANHMRKHYSLLVELHISGAVSTVRNETQLMLTQMVRELLNNVIQHSGVLRARVDAQCESGRIRVVVSDSRRGFDTRELFDGKADETRLSLLSIRERLRLFGGDLTLESTIGKGTRSEIVLPLVGL